MKLDVQQLSFHDDKSFNQATELSDYFNYFNSNLHNQEKIFEFLFSSIDKGTNYFLLRKDEKPIGIGMAQLKSDESHDHYFYQILDLYVSPEHRGSKLSQHLISSMIDLSSQNGILTVKAMYNDSFNFLNPIFKNFNFTVWETSGMNYANLDLSKRISIANINDLNHPLVNKKFETQLNDLELQGSYDEAGILLAHKEGINLGVIYNLKSSGYQNLLMFQDDSFARELLKKAKDNFLENRPLMDYSKVK